MSRIGKLAISVPAGASVTVTGQTIKAKGPKGELELVLPEVITPKFENNELTVAPRADLMQAANDTIEAAKAKGKRPPTLAQSLSPDARTQWGTARARASNMVEGVTKGYSKTLELVGVGYRAQMQGVDLKLALGYSHDVVYKAPQGIKIEAPKPTEIVISGADKQTVGQVAAEIKKFRPPEPYKGKGIRLQGEYVRRKEGKKK
ncbi:50S ribosomal protein L6 [Hyphomonas sp. WL0036]|uniref:50S ribosomal protein L6 n=1 Tax=Hyphomonas sediminis TaxID=2866160 RepID=UPI001C80F515|nr:50S ribosomal protein L6 [Hyphomonas sediminis]MBY9066729.1 50S ribosomal protein L6 [Hyphomonas sediminis]